MRPRTRAAFASGANAKGRAILMTKDPNASSGINVEQQRLLRDLPSVDEILSDPILSPAIEALPHEAVVYSIRRALDKRRKKILEGSSDEASEIILDVLGILNSL